MHHLLCKTKNCRSPNHPEGAATENQDCPDIFENMHQAQSIRAKHQNEQNRHETKRSIDKELRQSCTRQAEKITDQFAVFQSAGMIQREDRLVSSSCKQETDVRQKCNHRECKQQNASDHSRPAVLKKTFCRFPSTQSFDFDSSLEWAIFCHIS